MRWAIACTLATLGWLAFPASAATRRVHLDLPRVAGCPGPYTFSSQVQARTSLADFTASGTPADVEITVRLRPIESEYEGTMTLVGLPTATPKRSLRAATCDEVIAGLALFAARALDPSLEPAAITGSASVSASASAASSSVAPPVAVASASARPPAPIASVRRPEAEKSSLAIGGHVGVLGPDWSWVFDAYVDLDTDQHSLRLRVLRSRTGALDGPLAARYGITALRIDAAPRTFGDSIRFAPTLILELGGLDSEAKSSQGDLQTTLRPWMQLGIAARVSARVLGLVPELELSVAAPLIRDRFLDAHGVEVRRTPWVTGTLLFGIAWGS